MSQRFIRLPTVTPLSPVTQNDNHPDMRTLLVFLIMLGALLLPATYAQSADSLTTAAPTAPLTHDYGLRSPGTAEKIGYHPGDSMIVIPASVRMIPPYCFAGCKGLRRVRFARASQLGQIGDFAFAECEDLTHFEIPDGVKGIGEGAFRGCVSLRSIRLPAGIWEVSRETFAYCRNLQTIVLPRALRNIKPLAFLDCRSLLLDSLPPRLRSIGNNAFGRCYSLTSIIIPPGCEEVESYAFADCTSLEAVVLPAKTEMLGELLFSGCSRLRSITVRALVPPIIECNSTLFEPDDKDAWKSCHIVVPTGRVDAYRRSPFWNRFRRISTQK